MPLDGVDRVERLDRLDREVSALLRLGIGGPVGSGKTALVADLCRTFSDRVDLGVVTNDIYTTEDADFLERVGVLDPERIVAVETGCCPHTAIRDDIAANLDAIDQLRARFPAMRMVIVESGGDNLTATFSRGLVEKQVFVVDVAGGDKVPRKGGPGVTRSDLLVINKVDLADRVGADLTVMESDARRIRGARPVCLISLRTGDGVERRPPPDRGVDGRRGRGVTSVSSASVSSASVRLARGPVVEDLRSTGAVTFRPTRWGVWMVGTGAHPIGGDRVVLRVAVGPGCRTEVRSVSATVARRGSTSAPALRRRSRWRCRPRHARPDRSCGAPNPGWPRPGRTIPADARVKMAAGAGLVWRDEFGLGRHGEDPGPWRSRLRVSVAGRVVLASEVGRRPRRPGLDQPIGAGRGPGPLDGGANRPLPDQPGVRALGRNGGSGRGAAPRRRPGDADHGVGRRPVRVPSRRRGAP